MIAYNDRQRLSFLRSWNGWTDELRQLVDLAIENHRLKAAGRVRGVPFSIEGATSMKRRTALGLAKAQIAGGAPWGNVIESDTLFVCQKCGGEYHLRYGDDPCAFCDPCKDDVLLILAKALLKATAKKPAK